MDFFYDTATLPEKEIISGFHAKMFHLNGLTIAYWRVEKGSLLPEHSHIHEQVTNVISGEFEMTVAGKTQICTAGGAVAIPSNVVHSGKALTDCYLIDVFQPVREDYQKKMLER